MPPLRLAFSTAILAMTAACWWLEQGPLAALPPALPEIIDGTPYRVVVDHEEATVDLNFSGDERYLIVMASLAGSEGEHVVSISGRPVSGVISRPITPVQPLDLSHLPPIQLPDVPNTGAGTTIAAKSRDFYLHVTDGALDDPRSYRPIRAALIAEGRHVRVYLDGDQTTGELYPGVVVELIRIFDEEIYPASSRHYGRALDVDGDGKFAVVISHWLGKLQGGRTSVGGFVRGSDFTPAIAPPFGNRADVLYLNSNIAAGPQLKTLLAHEYTHAVLFSARRRLVGITTTVVDEEDWLNEAIAHLAENRHRGDWSNLDHRIHAFLQDPAASPLVVSDYYRTGRWRDHGCRGATYLFLRWCADNYGEEIVRQLIHSRQSGRANLEHATGRPFDELFRRWTIALARPAENYRYLSLNSRLGRFDLQGVARKEWFVDGPPIRFPICGTACQFVEISAENPRQFYRVTISAPASAKLQVTLIKCPVRTSSPDAPGAELAAR